MKTNKKFLILSLLVWLLSGFFLLLDKNSYYLNLAGLFISIIAFILFFIWLSFEIYDFNQKKFVEPSLEAAIIIGIFLMFMSIGGGTIGIISASILLSAIFIKIFLLLRNKVKK